MGEKKEKQTCYCYVYVSWLVVKVSNTKHPTLGTDRNFFFPFRICVCVRALVCVCAAVE
jgi:hypothetical protein